MNKKLLLLLTALSLSFSTIHIHAEESEAETEVEKEIEVIEEAPPSDEIQNEEKEDDEEILTIQETEPVVLEEEPVVITEEETPVKEEVPEEITEEVPPVEESAPIDESIVEAESAEENVLIETTPSQEENSINVKTLSKKSEEFTQFTVTYHFYYRKPKGTSWEWKEIKYSQEVTSSNFNASKAVSYFSNQIIKNNAQIVKDNTTSYIWLNTWTDQNKGEGEEGKVLTDADRVYINTKLFQTTTDIYYYADYSEESVLHLTANYIDNIGHGSSSWHNESAFSEYTHIFEIPKDIPEGYNFLYWKGPDGKLYYPESEKPEENSVSIKASNLTEDTILNFVAVYKYSPEIEIIYHNKEEIQTYSSRENIDIYEHSPWNETLFYEDDTIINQGDIIEAPEPIVTTEKLNTKITYDVFVRYFTVTYESGRYNNFETQTTEVTYGSNTPAAPKITKNSRYSFVKWNPAVADKVFEDVTYVAQWRTITPPSDPDPEPIPTPTPIPPEPEPEPTPAPTPTPPTVVPTNPIPQIITPVEAEVVEPEPTPAPSAAPVEVEIEEPEVPLVAPGNWALINLITTILSVIIALGMLLTGLFKKTYEEDDNSEDEEDKGKHKKSKIFGIFPAILSVLLFLMTEDIRLPMVLVDKWTLPMIIILIISIILAYLTKNKKKEENEEEDS